MREIVSMEKMLFCVGVTKGGTTWLHWVLSQHPQVAELPRKEFHYFLRQAGDVDRLSDFARMRQLKRVVANFKLHAEEDPRRMAEFIPDWAPYGVPHDPEMVARWRPNGQARKHFERLSWQLDFYRNYLEGPVDDDWYKRLFSAVEPGQWPMDFSTTGYLTGAKGFEAMAGIAEDSRAMIVLRDPIERLWSHVRFHAEIGKLIASLRYAKLSDIRAFVEKHRLLRSSLYADAVENIYAHFAPEKRLVLNFEDIRGRPEGVYLDMQRMMGLDPIKLPTKQADSQIINSSESMPMPPGVFAPFIPQILEDLHRLRNLGLPFVEPWIANAEAHLGRSRAMPLRPLFRLKNSYRTRSLT